MGKRCVVGTFTGMKLGSNETHYTSTRVTMKIRCGKWACPGCREKKAKKLYRRVFNGQLYEESKKMQNGFRSRYHFKLLTLTYGGKEKRAAADPKTALVEMQDAFAKLRKDLRHLYGHFHYLKVVEGHKDGWPHLHIVLAGGAIRTKGILQDIERLWRQRYGFGFVRLNEIRSPEQALKYVLKYVFKEPMELDGNRLYTSSRDALEKAKKEVHEWLWHSIMWEGSEEGEDYQKMDCLYGEKIPDCPF